MKRNTVKRSLSVILAAAMILGNVSSLTARAEVTSDSGEPETVSMINEDMTSDIWGSDAGWTVTVDDWSATGASVSSFTYSGDSWMNAPSDGSDNGVKFWFGSGDGVLTLSQDVALTEGTYKVSSECMGEGASFHLEINGEAGEDTALTGYNNWLTGDFEYTVSEDTDAAVSVVLDVKKEGWGYINNVKLFRLASDEAGESSSEDDGSGEASSEASGEDEENEESSSEASSGSSEQENEEEGGNAGEGGNAQETEYVWNNSGSVNNGDFETGDDTGWTVVMPGADGEKVGTKVYVNGYANANTTNMFNYWNDLSGEEELSLSQTISGVKAGTYKVSLKCEGAAGESGLVLKVTDGSGNKLCEKSLGATTGWDQWDVIESGEFTCPEDTDLTIEISGKVPGGYWGDLDEIALLTCAEAEEDTSVEAPIYVEKVSAADLDFITGVDVSSYVAEKNSGVKYYDYDGNELSDQGFFDFLAGCGVNYVRVRVWNDPTDGNGNYYGGGNCDPEVARKIGVWASNAGMKVLVDFHYSDFWADPGKQTAPKSMAGMSVEEKAQAIETFTKDSLESLLGSGVNVGMVQIGNETNNGVAGEKSWENMAKIFSAGSRAVRTVARTSDRQILVAVHFTNPEKSGNMAGYAANLDTYGVDYDVFATSYYPYWHGTLENLNSVLSNIGSRYDKMVMVAETSYIHTWEDGDGHENTEREGKNDTFGYDVSVQGQANAVRAVVNTVANIEQGIGVFYWEPAWIPVQVYDKNADNAPEVLAQNKELWEKYGSGWASSFAGAYDKDAGDWYGGSAVDNEAWFDFTGHPLDSAMIYNYVRTGATAPVVVTSVKAEDVVTELGKEISLPGTAVVTWSDGSKKELAVTWDQDKVDSAVAAGVGTYDISGTVEVSEGETKEVTIKLTIDPVNNLVNPGFEDADMSMWTITDANSCVGRQDDTSNVRTGRYCLKFWDNKDIEYSTEQKVTLDAGIYKLGCFIEGGDAGDGAEFRVYAKVSGGEEYSVDTGVTGWQNWANPEMTDIVVTADGTEVVIGVSVKAQAGAWGAWDDFYLYRTGDYVAPEPEDDGREKAGVTGWWKIRLLGTYFVHKDGSCAKGRTVIDGNTYYFFRDGRMARAYWLTENGKTYYFKLDGRMATGRLRILLWTYKFDENGVLIR